MSELSINTSPKLVQEQKLILTQELQLFLKLIQMNTLEIKEYLEEQLIENPTLEEVIDTETDKKDEENEIINALDKAITNSNYENLSPHYIHSGEPQEEDSQWENLISSPQSLLDHIKWQIEMLDLTLLEKEIALLIAGNINEDGYLETDIEGLVKELLSEKTPEYKKQLSAFESEDELKILVENTLLKLQKSLEPVGIAARNLQECLRLQAEELGYDNNSTIIKIIENHLEDIADKNYNAISDSLKISKDEVKECGDILKQLEPKPGRPFYGKDQAKYVVPDFYLYKIGNTYQLQLSKDFPRLRINSYYKKLIKQYKKLSQEEKTFLKEKLEAAQRILRCIEERETIIKKVVENIIEMQKDFFEYGEEYLKPLRLKDIARKVNVHESTVSRITRNRYIQIPSGIIELKSLFTRGLNTSTGKQVSFEKVKMMIKEIIKNESPQNPFSDEDIAKILKQKNVNIARRTVAKYRKILNIPSSSQRVKKSQQ